MLETNDNFSEMLASVELYLPLYHREIHLNLKLMHTKKLTRSIQWLQMCSRNAFLFCDVVILELFFPWFLPSTSFNFGFPVLWLLGLWKVTLTSAQKRWSWDNLNLKCSKAAITKKARFCDQKESGTERQSEAAESTPKAFTKTEKRQWHVEKDTLWWIHAFGAQLKSLSSPVCVCLFFHVWTRYLHPEGLPSDYTISMMLRLLPETPQEPFALWEILNKDDEPLVGLILDSKFE